MTFSFGMLPNTLQWIHPPKPYELLLAFQNVVSVVQIFVVLCEPLEVYALVRTKDLHEE